MHKSLTNRFLPHQFPPPQFPSPRVPPATDWKLTRNPSSVLLNMTTKEKKITMPYTSVKPSTVIKNFCIYYCLASFLICGVDCLPACVFSHVGLFATPWTVAHQAPLSMGFSRQEYWSGLPCPPPGDLPNPGLRTSVSCTSCISSLPTEPPGKPLRYIGGGLVAQSCPTLFDPMDCSLPGSSVHGIFQARILEWVAIAFSTEIDWADVIRSPISQIRRLNFKYCVLL